MSTTDVLIPSPVSAKTPPRKRRRTSLTSAGSSPFSNIQKTWEEEEEIEKLYEKVPQLYGNFNIITKIGEGTFSTVYVARIKAYPEVKQSFALKYLNPVSKPERITKELSCLQQIGGENNVMGVHFAIREKHHVVIIMPYFPHDRFQDFVGDLDVNELRDYMKNLLLALAQVHKHGIIHRDVKPSNFLYNRKQRKYALVDFGLAQETRIPVCALNPSQSKPQSDTFQVTPVSPVKRKSRRLSMENQPVEPIPLSPRKSGAGKLTEVVMNAQGPLLDEQDKTNLKDLAVTMGNNLTPPTPDLTKLVLSKNKSPRRYLLAKRTLMAKTKEDKHSTVLLKNTKTSTIGKETKKVCFGKGVQSAPTSCQCFGLPQICSVCMARKPQIATRAGTPGFRPPEVLMKHPDQTTAVDTWAAGVILLSLLSGRYPFFKAQDDMTALAQIISIMGSDEMKKAAEAYGKNLLCNPAVKALDIQLMCEKLRASAHNLGKGRGKKTPKNKENSVQFPKSAYDLLKRLLDLNPYTRISATEALEHPFITEC